MHIRNAVERIREQSPHLANAVERVDQANRQEIRWAAEECDARGSEFIDDLDTLKAHFDLSTLLRRLL